jgi:hypothetical protein
MGAIYYDLEFIAIMRFRRLNGQLTDILFCLTALHMGSATDPIR